MLYSMMSLPFFVMSYFVCMILLSRKPEKYYVRKGTVRRRSGRHWIYALVVSLFVYGAAGQILSTTNLGRYDTVEDALNAKYMVQKVVKIIEKGDTAFVFYADLRNHGDVGTASMNKVEGKWRNAGGRFKHFFLEGTDFLLFFHVVNENTGVQIFYGQYVIEKSRENENREILLSDNINGDFEVFMYERGMAEIYYLYSVVDSDITEYVVTYEGTQHTILPAKS